MITKNELEEYAKLRGMKNIGHAEKDYFQSILLFVVYQNYGSEIVFKGGTALSKCFGLNRFSEDLDFSCKDEVNFQAVAEGLKRFRIEFETEEDSFERSRSWIVRIKGPLFNGNRNSYCKVKLDFSFREKTEIKPVIKSIGRFLEEIPSFDVYVMSEEEIFAEKIRAVMTRNKARDVYDLYFLAEKGVKLNKTLAEKKLEYYSRRFDLKEFAKALKEKKSIWKSELSGLIENVPDFTGAVQRIMKAVK
ncbi:MAG: nucleotidyl transferase AbiEii/AbiGii toxin family protein [Candidatus Woesearchaeota archaeon]